MKLISLIVKIWRRIFFSASAINNVIETQKTESATPPPIQRDAEVREVSMFTRRNNLIEEFAYEPIPIYSGNLDYSKPIGMLQSDGNILAVDKNGEYTNKIVQNKVELYLDEEGTDLVRKHIQELLTEDRKNNTTVNL